MDNIETEHIQVGQILMKEGKCFYIDGDDKGWTTDLDKAQIFGAKNNMDGVKFYLDMYEINTEDIELIPVKKVTQYQLGEF